MNCDDGFGFWGDAALDVCWIEVVSARAKVCKNRNGLLVQHAYHGADISDGRGDDFITGSDARRCNRNVQRRGARRTGHHTVHRTDLLETVHEKRCLRSFPVKERVLAEHGVQALTFWIAPAQGLLCGLLN